MAILPRIPTTPSIATHLGATESRAVNPRTQVPFLPTLVSDRKIKVTLKRRELLMIVTQLSIMLKAGVDLAEAVRCVAQRSASANTRLVMGQVYVELESGKPLSQALADNQQLFGQVLVASVAAGESSGRLPEVLSRLSTIIRDDLRLGSSVRSALSYPLVLLLVTLLVLAAMIFFVLPQFAGVYKSSRAPTPALTQLLLDGSELARSYWWVALSASVGLCVAIWRSLKSVKVRRQLDRLVFRIPALAKIGSSIWSGRMFRLQGAMLASGVPILEVLQLTKNALSNSCFTDLIGKIEDSVISGRGMASVLSQSAIIPSGAADMIATAENNGQLGSVMQTVGEFFESEGEQYLSDAVKIAEPAIIVVLGLIVGSIVLAVMLPLLDLSTAGRV